MKRKTSTTPTKIWSFGPLKPTENAELFHDHLYQATRYYNQLIEIERRRRDRFRVARSEHTPELSALEKQWQDKDAVFQQALTLVPKEAVRGNKRARKLTPELLAQKEELRQISARM